MLVQTDKTFKRLKKFGYGSNHPRCFLCGETLRHKASLTSVPPDGVNSRALKDFRPGMFIPETGRIWLFADEVAFLLELGECHEAAEASMRCCLIIGSLPCIRVDVTA